VVGGVGVGAAAIKVWKGRDATPADKTASDAGTAADAYPGTGMPATTGSSPPGVIVPPIVMGGDGASASDLGAAFAGIIGGTITDLTGFMTTAIDAQSADTQTWIGAFQGNTDHWIDALAAAGQAPAPVTVTPTPVNITVAAPPPAPVPAAPAPPAPAGNGCPPAFPHRSSHGCYKCTKDSGPNNSKWTHRYQDGHIQGNNDQC
jgi:hypothetical protein